ncbi:hypothetical protein AB833_01970 [Chromatiales bacterium (ex Bugula neritina AB1)]|nr:hypothetical protein AB833_01970 [Chromatiales bacterium (ex Bugula neritina AB1)]
MCENFVYLAEESRIKVKFPGVTWAKDILFQITILKVKLDRLNGEAKNIDVTFDMTTVVWVESSVLISLLVLFKNYGDSKFINIILILKNIDFSVIGENQDERNKATYLCFLEKSGFYQSLPEYIKIETENGRGYSKCHFDMIKETNLDTFVQAVPFINFEVRPISDYCSSDRIANAPKLGAYVEKLIEDGALSIHGRKTNLAGFDLQRILLTANKILFEGLSNIIEHAYIDGSGEVNPHFGIYARLRRPENHRNNLITPAVTVHDEMRNRLVGSDEFTVGVQDWWLEIIICDLGCGLKSHLPDWIAVQKKQQKKQKFSYRDDIIDTLQDIQRRVKDSKQKHPDVIKSLGHLLFVHGVTRISERNTERSEQTGLQEIALVLDRAGRAILTDGIEAYGGKRFESTATDSARQHSSNKHQETLSSRLYGDPGGNDADQASYEMCRRLAERLLGEFDTSLLSLGTIVSITLQPESEIYNDDDIVFRPPNPENSKRLLKLYLDSSYEISNNHILYDKRFSPIASFEAEDRCRIEEKYSNNPRNLYLVVRLPRVAFKNDITSWIFLKNVLNKRRAATKIHLLFVDVNTLYAHWLVRRIEQYTSGRIAVSSLSSISVFTNTFLMWGIEKKTFGKKIELELINYQETRAFRVWANITNCLRRMDTTAFWASYKYHNIQNVYIPNEIDWTRTSRRMSRRDQIQKISVIGYLEFTEALLSPERYRTCQRALLRFYSLISKIEKGYPRLIATDDMLRRLESDINRYPKTDEIAEQSSTIVLSSVVITGGTHRRYLERSNEKVFQLCFFNRKREIDGDSLFSLMDWFPGNEHLPRNSKKLYRITGTAFVSELGDKSIQVPSVYWDRENARYMEYYERTKSQTYFDFIKMNVLSIGHVKHGKRHELIHIDLSNVLDLIKSSQAAAWKWISRRLYSEHHDKRKSVILVYPNTKHADKIIQWFLAESGNDRPINMHIVPVNFLRSRTIEPILVSPRIDVMLEEILTRNDADSVEIRIVDSGVVSGSTVNAIEQKVHSVIRAINGRNGQCQETLKDIRVVSIALLDRSGNPMYSELVEDHSRVHHRYWRWDMPSLGGPNSCSVCRAKNVLEPIEIEFFHQVDSKYDSEDRSLFELDFHPIHAMSTELSHIRFGNLHGEGNTIRFSSGLEMIGVLVELTRLLHRADIALDRAIALVEVGLIEHDNFRPDLSILILSTHLLLFDKSFTFWEKYNYAIELIKSQTSYSPSINTSTKSIYNEIVDRLSAYALFSLDADLMVMLAGDKRRLLRQVLKTQRVTNHYIAVFLVFLERNYDTKVIGDDIENTNIYGENIDFIRGNPHKSLQDVISIIGTHRTHHTSSLKRSIPNTTEIVGYYSTRDLGETVRLLKILIRHLKSINRIIDTTSIKKIDDVVGLLAERAEVKTRHLEDVISLIYSHKDSILPKIIRELIPLFKIRDKNYGADDSRYDAKKVTDRIISDVERKNNECFEDAVERLSIDKYAVEPTNKETHKFISCSRKRVDAPQRSDAFIYVSDICAEIIRDVMLNACHSEEYISDPWLSDSYKALMWYQFSYDSESARMEFINYYNEPERDIYYKKGKSDIYEKLKQHGYEISWEKKCNNKLLTTLKFPIIDWSGK